MKQNNAILSYPSNQVVFHVIIPNVVNAIIDNPPARPSRPSVILTALLLDASTNKINYPYNHPIFSLKFKLCIQIRGSLSHFKNK